MNSAAANMADRKGIQKYYPGDFDPSLLTRSKNHKTSHQIQVINFVCPFRSMRCLSCGAYTTKGKKFYNSPKHISPDTYLGVKIVRLHCKCPSCAAEIIIETDPKNMDYRIVSGAKRGYEVWCDNERVNDTEEQRLERLERETQEADPEEAKTTLEDLEHKYDVARKEMAVADALDEIQAANARREDGKGKWSLGTVASSSISDEAEDAELARAAFKGKKRCSPDVEADEDLGVDFSVVRPAKRKKDFGKALGIKRKLVV
jgi:hypothetical protein